jgi:isopentenyldiphosphate isomerase
MNSKYYKEQQIIPLVDREGKIIDQMERWKAHSKGVLHKGWSIALLYKDKYILQHRRHPAFDGTLDLTTSSHQILIGKDFDTLEESAIKALEREWVNLKLVGKPKNLGTVYYKAKDPKSIYTEHEVCDFMVIEVKEIPVPNFDFAYGYSLVTKDELKDKNSRIYEHLAPWVKVALEENKL